MEAAADATAAAAPNCQRGHSPAELWLADPHHSWLAQHHGDGLDPTKFLRSRLRHHAHVCAAASGHDPEKSGESRRCHDGSVYVDLGGRVGADAHDQQLVPPKNVEVKKASACLREVKLASASA